MYCECLQLISLSHPGNDRGWGSGARELELRVFMFQVRSAGFPPPPPRPGEETGDTTILSLWE